MNKPKHIYKFQTFDQFSLRNLKNSQIYFNRPIDFNDPFDCAVTKDAVSHTKKDLLDLLNSYIKEGRIKRGEEYRNIADVPPDVFEMLSKNVESVAEQYQEYNLHHVGCSCFSAENKHILMWSHYANGHRGFCLEFDTSFNPFRKNLFRVKYSKTYPKWRLASMGAAMA